MTIQLPPIWKQIATGLEPVKGRPGTFSAENFDVLYDCPILMGNQEYLQFAVKGVPHYIAIEKVFVNANPQSTLLLGQARGTAICAAVMHDLPIAEYTALQVKQAVVGNGHAKKEQVQEMVKRLLKLAGAPSPDAADALACAICHAHGGHGFGTIATNGYRMRNGRLV